MGGVLERPDMAVVTTPVPITGHQALAWHSPGALTWFAPVTAGIAVTVSVQLYKRSGYGSEQLPYLELDDLGALVTSTMANTTDAWVTVGASITPRATGVLTIRVVRPAPTYGSNWGNVFLSASAERRASNEGTLFVANLRITGGTITTGDFVRLVNGTVPLDVLVTATGSPPNVGENVMLAAILNKTAPQEQTLKLYVNDVFPGEGDTAGTFTEAAGFGYAAKSLAGASWTITNGDPTTASYAAQVFTFTGALGLVYGYFIVQTTSEILLWAERFADGPYNVVSNGTTITVTPTLGAD